MTSRLQPVYQEQPALLEHLRAHVDSAHGEIAASYYPAKASELGAPHSRDFLNRVRKFDSCRGHPAR